MKKIIRTVVAFALLFVLELGDSFAAVTLKAPAGNIQIGSFPEYSFRVEGLGTNLFLEVFLMRGDVPVGLIAGIVPYTVTNDCASGRFSWDLTRMVDLVTNYYGWVVWPEPGQYKILLGISVPTEFRTKSAGFDRSSYAAIAETPLFELVGSPPPLVIHRFEEDEERIAWLFISGNPGDRYTLLISSSFKNPSEWHESFSLEIPFEGVFGTGVYTVSKKAFFLLRKEEAQPPAPKP